MNRRAAVALLALGCAQCTWIAAAAQQVSIDTTSQGEGVVVTAFADMQVDPRTAWSVISDYDHLAEFIPDMQSSRVVRRDGDRLLVDQAGHFGFLFFQQPVTVRLEVVESPRQQHIVARAVSGNLRQMEGRYALEVLATGEVRLSYAGRVEPDFPLPPVVGKAVLRRVMARQFNALVKEIVRRDAAAGALPAPR
ncbi:SRPBCC family protein [Variovorax sp. J22P271]|uniref:SRPBCC family protein n=1 Tax=Variovorax davisae TaxID=3053515 RepID=UPI00257563F6|nr:SRPBCC family protein [Variovorax sp. J22P271]MDM0032791.1 SRPBCC family protein [Variovorax sp. J22P271]